ncbi:MAG: DUF1830 domain-containing protein [Cyanobacteria bacterium P01_C01_bin.73]
MIDFRFVFGEACSRQQPALKTCSQYLLPCLCLPSLSQSYGCRALLTVNIYFFLIVMTFKPTTCYYANTSDRLQVARIADVPDWYFERVIFPGQRLMFDAPRQAHLEIFIDQMDRAILTERIACGDLEVQNGRELAGSIG